jgi:hypothetical protein
MTDDPNSLPRFLAALKTMTDNALKSVQEFRGVLDGLASKAAEIDTLEKQLAAEKTQLANVRALREVEEQELEKIRASSAKISAALSVPLTKAHEIRVQLRDWEAKR